MNEIHLDPTKKHSFTLAIDCRFANPNGAPDDDNRPRQRHDRHGSITDVSLKRKIRDHIATLVKLGYTPEEGNTILVDRGALAGHSKWLKDTHGESSVKKKDLDLAKFTQAAAGKFIDVRLFGHLITIEGGKSVSYRGPVQIADAQSTDVISPHEVAIVAPDRGNDDKQGTFGQRWRVEDAVYIFHGDYSPALAGYGPNITTPDAARAIGKVGTTSADLGLLWKSLTDHYEAAASTRGDIDVIGLVIQTHDHPLGSAPRQKLRNAVSVTGTPGSREVTVANVDHVTSSVLSPLGDPYM
jgi:CRISPR-associated protein Csd2